MKFQRKCGNPGCPRKMFTEQVPQLPPRCRAAARLRDQAGHEVTGRGITPAEAARHAGISWPAAHQAFAAAADPVLDRDPAAVVHLDIDEHRRGRARFAVDEQTGEYTLLADRRRTCLSGLAGLQGLLGQVQGRTADDATYWLAGATSAWRHAVQVVCIGLCSANASAVRRMLRSHGAGQRARGDPGRPEGRGGAGGGSASGSGSGSASGSAARAGKW